jgi:hypothetical protein
MKEKPSGGDADFRDPAALQKRKIQKKKYMKR